MPRSLRDIVTTSFVTGAILLAPLAVTLLLFKLALDWLSGILNPFIRATRITQYTANIELVAQLVTIALILAGITLVGAVARFSAGRRTLSNFGRVVNLVPLFRTVYRSVQQVATSLVERSNQYESVVYIEYPRLGVYSVGFVTGESPDTLEEVAGQEAYNVYLPSSPNPTGGRLELVPADRLYETDLSVRQGLRLLMTTGVTAEEEEAANLPLGGYEVPGVSREADAEEE
jgi:uncharacterized membrane protein